MIYGAQNNKSSNQSQLLVGYKGICWR